MAEPAYAELDSVDLRILQLLVEGRGHFEIGEKVYLSASGVRRRIDRMKTRWGIKLPSVNGSRPGKTETRELLRLAHERGLIEAPAIYDVELCLLTWWPQRACSFRGNRMSRLLGN